MATDTNSTTMDVLERIGDGFNAFSEWVSRGLTRMLGSSNERTVRKLGYIRTQTLRAFSAAEIAKVLEKVE